MCQRQDDQNEVVNSQTYSIFKNTFNLKNGIINSEIPQKGDNNNNSLTIINLSYEYKYPKQSPNNKYLELFENLIL